MFIFKTILKWFNHDIDCGEMFLVVTGPKQIEVKLKFTPKQVWLNLLPSCSIPVCQGEVDAFDVRIVPHGFIIIVRLASEYREIEWLAVQ